MNQINISVEIFKEADRRDISIDTAEAGIDYVRRVTTGIEIVRSTRLLRLGDSEHASLYPDKIRWPSLSADMNIVLTDRTLYSAGDELHYGVAYVNRGLNNLKMAVVDVAKPDFPELTVAHEFGHLFNLKHGGETWDQSGHCVDTTCLMYKHPQTRQFEKRVEQRGIKKIMEYYGYKKPEYENFIEPVATEFCGECAHQLDKTSLFMKKAKAGEYIPPEWL